ncbi:hypothetical protein T281_13625 [Rhodomicrobium udaipurense JA643]|uniref:Uncharacterized protein n=1 Tax=Rhodomicrobium udaipurense TaxID=1202716 RepID=A0A8I1KKF1_9HYPH|nr:hypothetical protein [Rhodomicrobium udaipurense]KAI93966.1 hypothetical protein T281_13625 [Rhodomicrobium udaipurense JA643]MBJ7543984.1 hypothetical protein [Rhodomicrobium udaipurense]
MSVYETAVSHGGEVLTFLAIGAAVGVAIGIAKRLAEGRAPATWNRVKPFSSAVISFMSFSMRAAARLKG